MSSVDFSQFYQFLAKFSTDGKTWADVADGDNYGDGDGTVIKAEFRQFMNGEWNGEAALTKDLIDEFWSKIDTNRSTNRISGTSWRDKNALNKEEMANLDKKIESYVTFNQFLADNLDIPSVLTSTGAQWKADVTAQLSEVFENFFANGAKGDIETVLAEAFPEIANKCTAQYFAVEYQEGLRNSILADYPDYKVADDSTLQKLIKNFIATIDGDTAPEDFTEELRDILDAYFATAGLGNGSDYDLSKLGYNANKINGIQLAVIAQTIKNDLAAEAEKYEGYETEFETAVQQFIDEQVRNGKTFEEIKDSASEFADSKYKKNLDTCIYIDKTYGDITANEGILGGTQLPGLGGGLSLGGLTGNQPFGQCVLGETPVGGHGIVGPTVSSAFSFYQRLVEEFGETIAKKIAQNDRYVAEYQKIIADVKEKVIAGKLELDEVADYIIEKLRSCLDKFMSNGLGDLSVEDLNTVYEKLSEAAEAQKDSTQALAQHRSAAISYCEALASKGEQYIQLIVKTFGTDYKATINKLLPGDIIDAMKKLMKEAAAIGGSSTNTNPTETKAENVTWPDLSNKSVKTGKTLELDAKATIKDANGKVVDAGRITYALTTSGSGSATINAQTGKITIKAGDTEGYINLKVVAYVDGVQIGEAKAITVTITPSAKPISDSEIAILKGGQSNHDGLSEWAQGQDASASTHLNTAKANAQYSVGGKIDELKGVLAKSTSPKFEATALNKAATALKSYYVNLIGVLADSTESGGIGEHTNSATFSYTDVNGNKVSESTTYTQQVKSNQANHTTSDTVSGITLHECTAGKNSYFIAINMQVAMQKLIEFYNAAI